MARRARVLAGVAAALVALAAAARARVGLELSSPHTALRPAAVLDAALARRIDGALAEAPVGTVEEAIAFALDQTGASLRFGLGHPTRLDFGVEERDASCIEYAHLFAAVFGRAAASAGLETRAHVIHTARARVFGLALPLRGFADHDWVLVTAPGGRRWHVDPTFADAWLGWDVTRHVRGSISVR